MQENIVKTPFGDLIIHEEKGQNGTMLCIDLKSGHLKTVIPVTKIGFGLNPDKLSMEILKKASFKKLGEGDDQTHIATINLPSWDVEVGDFVIVHAYEAIVVGEITKMSGDSIVIHQDDEDIKIPKSGMHGLKQLEKIDIETHEFTNGDKLVLKCKNEWVTGYLIKKDEAELFMEVDKGNNVDPTYVGFALNEIDCLFRYV